MTDPKYIADRDAAAYIYTENSDEPTFEIENSFIAGADWGYSRANSELEELKIKNEQLVNALNTFPLSKQQELELQVLKLGTKAEQLKQALDVAVEALKHYGNEEMWFEANCLGGPDVAAEALAKIKTLIGENK